MQLSKLRTWIFLNNQQYDQNPLKPQSIDIQYLFS